MNDNNNIASIKAVYAALEELANDFVFIGGATVSLYGNRPASEVRPTDDVDIVVELASYDGYASIEDQLRSKGFVNDTTSGVICRYLVNGITVDVMPTNDGILGFSNQWYTDGFKNAVELTLDENTIIKIFSAPYFIAAKLEAFNDRGKGDGRTSHDFEDIIYLLNYRDAVWDEMKTAPTNVKAFLITEFKKLIDKTHIYEWISAHLEYNEQRRVNLIVGGLNDLISEINK